MGHEVIKDMNSHHGSILDEFCKKLEPMIKRVWPVVEEYCGNYFEIDLGKVTVIVQKKTVPKDLDLADDEWTTIDGDENDKGD